MSPRTAKIEFSEAGRVRKKSDVGTGRKTLKLKRTGLHERAAARMRAMIIRGELAPGSPTQETRLSTALGVSRTPLREAMKLLAAEGLVELRPNRSARIADIETDRMFELFEALAGIERFAVEARDGETAGRLLSAHVQRTGTALWEVLAKTTLSRPAA